MNEPAFGVDLIHGSERSCDLSRWLPAGRDLSAARQQYLGASEWIVVSRCGAPVGFAAYRRADGQVRVVHELLLEPMLESSDARVVTETLLATLEMLALDDGITCLTFLLSNGVIIEPFEAQGYSSLALGNTRVWLQRKLGWPGWCSACSAVRQ